MDKHGECAFFGEDGRVCAIGAILPESLQRANCSWNDVYDHFEILNDYFEIINLGDLLSHKVGGDYLFISHLMTAHDLAKGDFKKEVLENLSKITKKYNLTIPE